MSILTIIRLVVAVTLVTAGCASLLDWQQPLFRPIFVICTGIASVVIMPRQERERAWSRKDLYVIALFLLAIAIFGILANLYFPKSWQPVATKVISHPAFVTVVWLSLLWAVYRRWRRLEPTADA
jgi:hypothetical protein